MGYRIHKAEDEFKVVEVVNGETKDIISDKNETKMRDMQKHLNFGGGFDGWTPDFFIDRIPTQ